MPKGTVKFFKPDRGFGFIVNDDGTGDTFVHISACNGQSLVQNQRVEFEMGIDEVKNKPCAVNVRAA